MNNIREQLNNKRILLLGYGREGKSTHRYIIKNNVSCETFIYDERNICDELIDNRVKIISMEDIIKNINDFDFIIKTPGISFMDIENLNIKNNITTQTELFIKEFKRQIIGITGTKGKSTTSSLIYAMMKEKYQNCIFCGNIGKPFFDIIEDIDEETIIVCELSSHQLENIKVSPHISIITNIYPEHLDHYKSYNEYIGAKINILRYQNDSDICIINSDIDEIMSNINNIKSKIYKLSMYDETMFHMKHDEIIYNNEVIFNKDNKRNIIGDHNLFDIMILFNIALIYNIDFNFVKEIVEKFNCLPHRLEYIGTYNNIKFYNDSISTIPETCIFALDNVDNVSTLIVGGLNRGISYEKLIRYLNSHLSIKIICMHDTGKIIYNEVNNEKYLIDDLKLAVAKAVEITQKDCTCLFSPAAASYGFYKNFEDRGNQFKEYVRQNS